jgi:hypothetical protein
MGIAAINTAGYQYTGYQSTGTGYQYTGYQSTGTGYQYTGYQSTGTGYRDIVALNIRPA